MKQFFIVSIFLVTLIAITEIVFTVKIVRTVKAWSPTIRQIDQTDMEGTECCTLRVYCDAPRGNIVYVTRAWGATSPGVTAIHQPDICK